MRTLNRLIASSLPFGASAWLVMLAGCAPDAADTGDSWLPDAEVAAAEEAAARAALEAGGAVEISMRASDLHALAGLPGLERLGPDPARAGWGRAIARDPEALAEALARGAGRLRPMTGDTSAPTGTVEINAGASWTRSASVTLALSATDDTGVTEMCVSNTATCTRWEGYATSLSWSIAGGGGAKTVNVWFRDEAGNVSAVASDGIGLDTVVPTNGSVTVTPSGGQVELGWSGYADTLSGVSSYKVMYAIGTATPGASCRTGTLAWEGTDSGVVLTGLGDGTTYNYIVCALDAAGNASTGTRVTTRPAPEFNPPTGGSVVINSGDTWTNRAQVTLELSASDDTAVSEMCVTSRATCTSWIAYQTPYTYTIAGTGDKTVSVWFRDTYNNVTAAPATDSIIVDTAKPVNGAVSTSGASGEVTVSWSGYSDALSGIASYRVVRATGTTAPTSCAVGTQIYDDADSSYTDTGLTDGTTYAYRVCAVDNAGNVSQGRTTTGRPAPEYNAPTGTVSINSGDAYARPGTVTLTISASDDSDVTHMCVSNTARCTTWIALSASKPWSLSGAGLKTVYVKLRDQYGNVSAATISDAITLDARGPTGGAATATAASGTAIDVSASGFTDAVSGVASYKVVYAVGSRAPTSCSVGTVGYTGTSASPTVSGLTVNTGYSFRVCAIDAVGNVGTGVTVSASTLAEGDPPTATSVTIDGGALYSLDADVDAALSATDASGVALMCLSDTPECPEWLPYDTSATWSFAEEEGTHTLYAWFEDTLGNATSEPATAEILIDWTAPVDGTAEALQTGDGQLTLSWSGYSDAGSGVDSYRVVHHADGHLPASCEEGDTLYSGSGTSVVLTGLTNQIEHSFRVCAYDMLGTASAGATASVFLYDTTPPAPVSVTINGGALYTDDHAVTVTAEATDVGGVADVCLSHTDAPCSDWQTYGSTLAWTLEPGEGDRTVYAYFRDLTGNVSATSASATIQVDQTLPTDGALSLTPGDGEVYAEWSGFDDEAGGSGLAGYWLVYAEGATAPATCDSGDVAYAGADGSVTVTGLTDGTRYSFRLCAEDGAGNLSAGVTASARPAPEFLPPDGTILIDGDAADIGAGAVTIDISATDDSTVSLMCLGEDPDTCTDWVAYSTTASWTFPAVEGTHTLYAWFEDEWYNTTVAAVSDDVYMDLTAPTGGAAAATATGDNSANVSWSGFSDATAGLASYKVVYARSGTPADCNSGTTGYTGTATSASITGLLGGSSYTFRVCAIDAVGNMSGGVTATASTPDTTAPTGTVSINSGAIGTRTTAVTLTFSPVDDSAISTMCVSNTSACTTYIAYTATRSHTLASSTAGVKTVYVYLRDASGNTSLALTDTIIMDATAPTNGTVTSTTTTARQIGLSWSGYTDAGSGLASYKVVYAAGTTAPANCTTAGTTLYTGTATSVTHTGLAAGAKYSYRVCAIDNATNTSTGTAKANLTVL